MDKCLGVVHGNFFQAVRCGKPAEQIGRQLTPHAWVPKAKMHRVVVVTQEMDQPADAINTGGSVDAVAQRLRRFSLAEKIVHGVKWRVRIVASASTMASRNAVVSPAPGIA